MVVTKIKDSEEKLKEKILKHETKQTYSSDRFKKIEEKVLGALEKQNTDEALKDVTI